MTTDRSLRARHRLSTVAAVSGAYDLLLGLALLAGRSLLAAAFAVPLPVPAIHADLNGLFLLAVGAGYLLPLRRPDAGRIYLWVMGAFLKGAGAALFVVDHLLRDSPPAFLLFAAADGTLALLTLWALMTTGGTRDGDQGSGIRDQGPEA